MKKAIIFSFLILMLSGIILSPFKSSFAADKKIQLYFFYAKGCPHCQAEHNFLDKLEKKYPEVNVSRYLASDPKNRDLLESFCQKNNAERYLGLVPLTFIESALETDLKAQCRGDFFIGFDSEKGMGKKIETAIKKILQNLPANRDNKVTLPLIGEISLEKYSLPMLTIILGFLDGFNVCSLGALVFILGIVLVFRSRKKTLIYGGIFILTTAIVYGLLMVLWYQLFNLLSAYLNIMHIVVGLVALAGGIYFFKQFLKFKKQGVVCETNIENKTVSRLSSRLAKTLKNNKNIFAIIGSIFIFAALVTIIEFPCSAAVPVVYSGILSQASLNAFSYFFYLLLFLILYMLDELVVFLVASLTMKVWLTSQKFVTYITLAEGFILTLLGLYYLFGWLF